MPPSSERQSLPRPPRATTALPRPEEAGIESGPAPLLVLRADGDPSTGIGHLMRCLALAQAWMARGRAAVLLSAGTAGWARRFSEAGVRVERVRSAHPDGADLHTTLAALGRLQPGRRPAWLALDGYHFDRDYQAAVTGAGIRLMVVDDTAHLGRYEAEVVVNQNPGADRLPYDCPPAGVQLLGPRYAMLRPEFTASRARRRIPAVGRRVLVTLGGGDPGGVLDAVTEALARIPIPGMEATVVAARAIRLPLATGGAAAHVRVLRDPPDMAALMAWADVAVSAAGGTALELACLGVPSLLIPVAENQRGVARGLEEAGAAVHLPGPPDRIADSIPGPLTDLCLDARLRRQMSRRGKRLVDGLGCQRILEVMDALGSSRLRRSDVGLRRATPEDAVGLWRLANDPQTRRNSLSKDPIPFERHLEWLESKLSSAETAIWIVDVGGSVAASARYERTGPGAGEVHYAVAPAYRGKGLGAKTLTWTCRKACSELGLEELTGRVLVHNEPSLRAMVRAGFTVVGEQVAGGERCLVLSAPCR